MGEKFSHGCIFEFILELRNNMSLIFWGDDKYIQTTHTYYSCPTGAAHSGPGRSIAAPNCLQHTDGHGI